MENLSYDYLNQFLSIDINKTVVRPLSVEDLVRDYCFPFNTEPAAVVTVNSFVIFQIISNEYRVYCFTTGYPVVKQTVSLGHPNFDINEKLIEMRKQNERNS